MPLWASYLVKVYAWRIILSRNGPLNWALEPFGLDGAGLHDDRHVARLLVPLAAVHDPAALRGLERIPDSLLEASSDLGARGLGTFRRVILPLAFPALVAGSIFTFSLTLGDYITPQIVMAGNQFIGNVVYTNVGVANNLPLAAAFATVPVDHGRLPAARASARARSRPCDSGPAAVAAAARDGADARVHLPAAGHDRALRVQRGHHAGLADRRLHDGVVRGLAIDEDVRDALWLSLKAALGATLLALVLGTLASLAVARYRFFGRERRSRSSSSSRSRCRGSSPGWR